MKRTLSYVRKAVTDYNMIEDNDRIAIGVSGGKDSVLLLNALAKLRGFYPKKFDITAITLDMGFEETDFSPIEDLCRKINVEYVIKKTHLREIIFDIRKETNPCSLCSKMRRGILHDAALEAGCGKIALGHNFDDAVETFFLKLFYEGQLGCFSPVSYLDRKKINLIRPLIYMPESLVRATVERLSLPVVKSPCPANGNTKRQYMKETISKLEIENPGLRERVFSSMKKAGLSGF